MGRTRNSTRAAKPAKVATKKPSKPALPATATVTAIADGLAARWPDVRVELDHENAFQLLIATILAAQSTDKTINTLTPAVFARYPTPAALGAANQAELEPLVFKSGFFRQKAAAIIATSRAIAEKFGGEVPKTIEGLTSLPGVARKTANVVLGNAFGLAEGFVVDTHITRLAARLGLSTESDPVKIEQDLMRLFPRERWIALGNQLIHHGRYICRAKDPQCEACPLAPVCPSAGLDVILEAKPAKPKPAKPKPAKPAKKAKKAKAR